MVNIYPGAKLVPAHPSKYLQANRSTFTSITDHITSGHDDPMGPAEMFATAYQTPPPAGQEDKRPANARKKASAHFIVGRLPEAEQPIIQCVDLASIAYHAGPANDMSVGIEHVAREPGEFYKGDPGLPLTEAQYLKSAKLHAWLCRLAGIPINRIRILGHAEADPTTSHTGCPAAVAGGWDWEKFIPMVERASFMLADIL